MGVVCLARAMGAGGFRRLFAIKVMHPHLAEDERFMAMLLDEAQLAARIHHPNVVPTIDVCTLEGCHFLVMDYVDGFQLADVVENESISRERRVRVGIRILLDVMAGLEVAHSLQNDDGSPVGLVHRDVSPQNILVGVDGIARLTDFGIALAASRISASRPGTVKGKPSYMAPEQVRAERVDPRADIWALGVILWEVLAGRRLFVGTSETATMLKVTGMPIESPRVEVPALSEALARVCLRALERDPARRYTSARQMAEELARAAATTGMLASSQEVANVVRRSFAHELEQRKATIRELSSALEPGSQPMRPRDIYDLPRLDGVNPPETGLRPVLQLVEDEQPEGEREPSTSRRRKTKVAPLRGEQRSTDPTITEIYTEVRRLRSGTTRGLVALSLVFLCGSLGFWFTRGAALPGSLTPPSPTPSATTAPLSAPTESSKAAPPAASAPEAKPEAPPRLRSSKRKARAPVTRAAVEREPAPPVIEENPYGLR